MDNLYLKYCSFLPYPALLHGSVACAVYTEYASKLIHIKFKVNCTFKSRVEAEAWTYDTGVVLNRLFCAHFI